ncbi:MAG: EamA family transporter [Alphaproteobacteria bacterium]|nr:EamA family transporter [Alphaproteobacteria bacterium]
MAMRPVDLLVMVFVMLLWGFNFGFAKWGLQEIPPILLMAMRFALTGLMLVPFVPLPRGRWLAILGVSVTLGCLHFPLMFTGLRDLDTATTSIAAQLQVPFSAILAWLAFRDRLRWRRLCGMALAFGGVVVIAGEPRVAGGLGSLLMIVGAAFFWALSTVQIKRIGDIDGLQLAGWMSLLAAPQLLAISLVLETGHVAAVAEAGWRTAVSLAYMTVVITALSYKLWYKLLQRYAVNQVMPFTLLVPVFGIVSGIAMLGESLSWTQVAGSAIVLAGVAIIVIRKPEVLEPRASGSGS